MTSKQQIISDITNHFQGTSYGNCYIGVTSDVEKRLFGDHNVSRTNGKWIHRTASSSNIAREVEQHFLSAGMDGGTGGGSQATKIVYAYQKTSNTKP